MNTPKERVKPVPPKAPRGLFPVVKGFKRHSGVCRNDGNPDEWHNQEYLGTVANIQECANRCDKRGDCKMINFVYETNQCTIGINNQMWTGIEEQGQMGCYIKVEPKVPDGLG